MPPSGLIARNTGKLRLYKKALKKMGGIFL
jgi:hypothetical protein